MRTLHHLSHCASIIFIPGDYFSAKGDGRKKCTGNAEKSCTVSGVCYYPPMTDIELNTIAEEYKHSTIRDLQELAEEGDRNAEFLAWWRRFERAWEPVEGDYKLDWWLDLCLSGWMMWNGNVQEGMRLWYQESEKALLMHHYDKRKVRNVMWRVFNQS